MRSTRRKAGAVGSGGRSQSHGYSPRFADALSCHLVAKRIYPATVASLVHPPCCLMLQMLFFRAAADVANPERREWPPCCATSKPASSQARLTILATEAGWRWSLPRLPWRSTSRKRGPLDTPDNANQARKVRTGQVSRREP